MDGAVVSLETMFDDLRSGRTAPEPPQPLAVGYAAPHFFAVRGHDHLSSAIQSGQALVRATLAAEPPEHVLGLPCEHYFQTNATPARIRAWEQTHGIELPSGDEPPRRSHSARR